MILSLLPNERTGDHWDKTPLQLDPRYTLLAIVHLQLFAPKGLPFSFSFLVLFFLNCVCLSFCFTLQVLCSITLAAWWSTLQQQQATHGELEGSYFPSRHESTHKHQYAHTSIAANILETVTQYNGPLLLKCAEQSINTQLLKLLQRRL